MLEQNFSIFGGNIGKLYPFLIPKIIEFIFLDEIILLKNLNLLADVTGDVAFCLLVPVSVAVALKFSGEVVAATAAAGYTKFLICDWGIE